MKGLYSWAPVDILEIANYTANTERYGQLTLLRPSSNTLGTKHGCRLEYRCLQTSPQSLLDCIMLALEMISILNLESKTSFSCKKIFSFCFVAKSWIIDPKALDRSNTIDSLRYRKTFFNAPNIMFSTVHPSDSKLQSLKSPLN
mgnify:CR=1 FL=1